MRRLALPLLLAALASPALAEEGPFDGRWAWDPAICANERGSGDLVPSEYRGRIIEHYESRCEITSLTPIGTMEQAWDATLACAGEGEEWTGNVIYALERDEDGRPRLLIEIGRDDGMVIVRRFCE